MKKSGAAHELFKILKIRTEKATIEFMFRTARIVNRLKRKKDFLKMVVLRKRISENPLEICR